MCTRNALTDRVRETERDRDDIVILELFNSLTRTLRIKYNTSSLLVSSLSSFLQSLLLLLSPLMTLLLLPSVIVDITESNVAAHLIYTYT